MSRKDSVYWHVQSLAADEAVRIKNHLNKNENEKDNVTCNNGAGAN